MEVSTNFADFEELETLFDDFGSSEATLVILVAFGPGSDALNSSGSNFSILASFFFFKTVFSSASARAERGSSSVSGLGTDFVVFAAVAFFFVLPVGADFDLAHVADDVNRDRRKGAC